MQIEMDDNTTLVLIVLIISATFCVYKLVSLKCNTNNDYIPI